MERRELLVFIAAVLTTLEEMNSDVAESTIYMALGMDWERWELVSRIMLNAGMVTTSHHRMSLTPKGKELAKQVNADLVK